MKTLSVVKYVFSLVGIGMLAGAFFWYQHISAFLEQATKAEGTVVDLSLSRSSDSSTYRPVVQFNDQKGEKIEFTSSTGSNPPSYSRGEKVEVLYLAGNPQDAKINGYFSLWGGPTIVGGMGSIFFLIGAGIILAPLLKGRRDEYLKEQGTPIETAYQRVEMNKSLSVNGSHPFRVLTQWQNPLTSEIHLFKSNNLWYDPSDYINRSQITVYIERDNPKKYYVDLSFLPAMAE